MVKGYTEWIAESYRDDASLLIKDQVEREFPDLNFDLYKRPRVTYLRSELPAGDRLDPRLEAKLHELVLDPPPDLLNIDVSLGYDYGNSITFTLLGTDQHNLTKAYHVTSASNLEEIRQAGIIPSRARSSQEFFKPKAGKGSFRIMTYSAIFLVATTADARKVAKFFNIVDPYLIEFNARGLPLHDDPFFFSLNKSRNFPNRSYLCLERIPPNRILNISPLDK